MVNEQLGKLYGKQQQTNRISVNRSPSPNRSQSSSINTNNNNNKKYPYNSGPQSATFTFGQHQLKSASNHDNSSSRIRSPSPSRLGHNNNSHAQHVPLNRPNESNDCAGASNVHVIRKNAKNDVQLLPELNVAKTSGSTSDNLSTNRLKEPNNVTSYKVTLNDKDLSRRSSSDLSKSRTKSPSPSRGESANIVTNRVRKDSSSSPRVSSTTTTSPSSSSSVSDSHNYTLTSRVGVNESRLNGSIENHQSTNNNNSSYSYVNSGDCVTSKDDKQRSKAKKLASKSASGKSATETLTKSDQINNTNTNNDVQASKKSKNVPNLLNKSEKSIEQILTEALQLTEDEQATLHQRSKSDSLAQQWHNRRRDQRLNDNQQNSLSSSRDQSLSNICSKNDNQNVQESQFSPILPSSSLSIQIAVNTINTPQNNNNVTPKESYSSPVNYAKTRFANVLTDSTRGQTDRFRSQSMVNEVKQAWERKAAVSSGTPISKSSKNTGRASPVRPYLTKGSVAERVMLFEKRPEMKKVKERIIDSSISVIRTKSPVLSSNWRTQVKNKENEALLENRTAKTADRRSTNKAPGSWSIQYNIPKFYYPSGRPATSSEMEAKSRRLINEFALLADKKATKEAFGKLCKAIALPLYWKQPLYDAIVDDGRRKNLTVTCDQFMKYWKELSSSCHDNASKFVRILSKGKRNYLIAEDFVSLMQDVIETHPGLGFLKEAAEFHSRYIHTVIARIFYCVNKSWSGRITVPELRKSNFLMVVELLEDEDDINQITDYFSYEHFYVIYCKFWELDRDHDLVIDKEDLMRHNEAAISSRMIDRIFSGAVTRGLVHKHAKMTYPEFVWFLLSEEDKRHPRSIEYWFRCMDIDGDGYLSMYELEYFYEEQIKRMEALGIEALPFNDCLCQMIDMVKPKIPEKISLSDLKNCKMTAVFYDTFFNLDKYLDHEQRDPFASKDSEESMSDWDKFAADEYELLVAEESAQHTHSSRD